MNEQNVLSAYLFLKQILFHSGERFAGIGRVHGDSVLYQHFQNRFIYFRFFFTVSRPGEIIQKHGLRFYFLFGHRYALFVQVLMDAAEHDIAPSGIFAGNADANYRAVIPMDQLTADKTGLCRACSRGKEYVIKVNVVFQLIAADFLIAIHISLGAKIPVAAP